MRGSGNRMRELRQARKLSQRQLAEAVETSQQQIQRIEAGLQTARIDLAIRIAKALGGSLAEVFPGLQEALAKRGVQSSRPAADDVEEPEEPADPDEDVWFVRCTLRGGGEVEVPLVGTYDLPRIRSWMDRGPQAFFSLDSSHVRLVINSRHLLHLHLFQRPRAVGDDDLSIDWDPPTRAFLADRAEPLALRADEELEAPAGDATKHLEAAWDGSEGPEEGRLFHFTNSQGEEIWLRPDDVALIEIPLGALHSDRVPEPGADGEDEV